jgi:hypothetical protein
MNFTNHISGVRRLINLAAKTSVSAFVQYNAAINKLISNIRFRFNSVSRVWLAIIVTAVFSLSVLPSSGQTDTVQAEKKSERQYVPLFGSDEMLEITLSLDLASFLKKKDRNQSYDALMTMHLSDSDSLQEKVVISYRGQSRYDRCMIPPARVTFKKPLYELSDSSKLKRIKLVNQCQQGYKYENYIIREYLVYRLYEVLTDTCYRTRLLKISYIDANRKRKPMVQYGIFIEPDASLARRTKMIEVRTESVSQRHMVPAMIDRIAIFNYMVSNWDWSVPGQHNIKVFTSTEFSSSDQGIPVPYDFDLTGVVNADYAIPMPETGLQTNRDRIYSGICRTKETFRHALMLFLENKNDFYAVVNESPYIDKAAKRDITWFLDQFFDQFEKEWSMDSLIDTFMETCKSFQR